MSKSICGFGSFLKQLYAKRAKWQHVFEHTSLVPIGMYATAADMSESMQVSVGDLSVTKHHP